MSDKHGRLCQLNFRVYFAGYIKMLGFNTRKGKSRIHLRIEIENPRPGLKLATCSEAQSSSVPTRSPVRVLYHLILMAYVGACCEA